MSTQPKGKPKMGHRVLLDHKQVGKRFIPPMMQLPGGLQEVHWISHMIPELLWLGLLNDRDYTTGATRAAAVMKAAKEASGTSPKDWFATVSSYLRLTVDQRHAVVTSLEQTGDLEFLQEALASLVTFYPECSFGFLFEDAASPEDYKPDIEVFKRFLLSMMNRWERPATMAQASAFYLGCISGMLKLQANLLLATSFPEIASFPTTETSKLVASGVRAAISLAFGPQHASNATPWATYFWNRGLELQPCYGISLDDEH